MKTLNLGIFGGLFDPLHIGHLIISQWVLEEFKLDKIIFVPAFNPPHKEKYSSYNDRYEMTRLAIRNNKDFLLSDVEENIKGKSYTIGVIRRLKKSLLEGSYCKEDGAFKLVTNGAKAPAPKKGWKVGACPQLYLLIGADQWNEIETWRAPNEIFKECKIIVLPRPNYKIKEIPPFYEQILISNSPLIDISSTQIRERIKKGLGVQYFVVSEVLKYINRHNLYT